VNLSQRVARITRTGLLLLAAAAVVNISLLSYLGLVLDPSTHRATLGARELRKAHLDMLDQETGLRAYLITGNQSFLEPYEGAALGALRLATLAEAIEHRLRADAPGDLSADVARVRSEVMAASAGFDLPG
jgi:CHASE3 domain sensor protein